MNTRSVLTTVLTVLTVLTAGCAGSFHDSYLVGDRWYKTNIDTYPVIIIGVDGMDTVQHRVLVSPGRRAIRVQGPGAAGISGTIEQFELDVRPCFTYYIVAEKASPLAIDFVPKVDFAEPLAGCTPFPAGSDK